MTPFYLNYPKDPVKNLEWRLACGERALTDVRFRHAIYDACLSGDTLVVTDHGILPITEIGLHHNVWDGTMWVSHDGLVYQGERETISAYGIRLTPDHQVFTTRGWSDASNRFDRADVRLPDGYREEWIEKEQCGMEMPMRLWCGSDGEEQPVNQRPNEKLWMLPQDACSAEKQHSRPVWCSDISLMGEHVRQMQQSVVGSLLHPRCQGHFSMRTMETVREFSGGHGRETTEYDTWEDRQRGKLRTWELPLGEFGATGQQSSQQQIDKDIRWGVYAVASGSHGRRKSISNSFSHQERSSRRRTPVSTGNRTEAVYDLLNCGPRRAFTVIDDCGRPLLVHNCMEDVLFFMAFACWAIEPRAKIKLRPFVPYAHQESVFVAMDRAIDDSASQNRPLDVLLDKSRAQGGTYGYLWILQRRWLRDPLFSAGYVTRNEALVDSVTDDSTLFWKLAWGLTMLPTWMLPRGFDMKKHRSLSSHTILNPENGATHAGYAAGQDVSAGGRKSVFACDEFGSRDFVSGGKDESVMESLHDVSSCIFLVSARYVDSGVFHKACEDKDSDGLHLILDWKDNPEQSLHSYVVRDGKPEARLPEERQPVAEYHAQNPDLRKRLEAKGFKWEGVVRSPWYDRRCLRQTATPRLIASQLDRDPRGAVGKVFQGELLDRMKKDCCRAPIWQGTPVFDSETLALQGLLKQDDGPLKLWFKPGPDFSAPLGPYTLGCDVAIGSDGAYSSNSVCSGIDNSTGQQVLEYTVNGVPMIKFARIVVGLGKWLHQALVGWEDSGMVAPFAKEILEILYYSNVYYRTVEAIGVKKKTKKPGWWNGKDEHKADLFEKLALGMETGKYTPRSEEMIRESGEYEWDDGKIVHQPTKNRGAREKAHGDRTIAAGVSWLVFWEGQDGFSVDSGEERDETPEYGSFLWREQQERLRVDSGSPEFGIQDVIAY